MAYDVESDRVILFGGLIDPENGLFDDTWAYDVGENAWTKMSPATSAGQAGGAMAYDVQSDRMVLFTGEFFYGIRENPPAEPASETWTYDYNTDTWTNMEPTEAPHGLNGTRMVYDAESDRMILFGGLDAESIPTGDFRFLNDTWAYDLDANTWTKMAPDSSPPGRNWFAMAYDPGSDRVILFGGGWPGQRFDDLWAYDYNTDTWEALNPSEMPADRSYSNLVYAVGSERMMLFGGANAAGEVPLSDMWVYHLDTNTWTELADKNAWTKLEPGTYPSPRGWYGAVYSTRAERVILFGGGSNRDRFTGETWIYDPEANVWTNVTPSP